MTTKRARRSPEPEPVACPLGLDTRVNRLETNEIPHLHGAVGELKGSLRVIFWALTAVIGLVIASGALDMILAIK